MSVDWQLEVDCADPRRLAEFWCAALGYVPAPPPGGAESWDAWFASLGVPEEERGDGATINDPDGRRPPLCFLKVPEGKVGKNRLHVDVRVGGGRQRPHAERWGAVTAAYERLTRLGATEVARYDGADGRPDHYVMADPEGNEFCLV
jgi:hypothetical protein